MSTVRAVLMGSIQTDISIQAMLSLAWRRLNVLWAMPVTAPVTILERRG